MKKILFSIILLNAWAYADFNKNKGVILDSSTALEWQDDYSDNAGKIKNTT